MQVPNRNVAAAKEMQAWLNAAGYPFVTKLNMALIEWDADEGSGAEPMAVLEWHTVKRDGEVMPPHAMIVSLSQLREFAHEISELMGWAEIVDMSRGVKLQVDFDEREDL